MPSSPFISVVTPSLNQSRYIRKNIESVLEQGQADIEHIVVDGGSTDETTAILKEYPHLQWISERDKGQSDALNKGIAMARGEWILWINSDDFLLPGCIRAFTDFLKQQPRAEFVYSNLVFADEEGREISRRAAWFSEKEYTLHYWWRRGVGFAQPGSFFRRSLWEKFGPFDVSLHYAMDRDFWLKICDTVEFLHLDAYTAAYRLHEESKTLEGWRPFLLEQMPITQRYWNRRGTWRKWQFRFLLPLMFAKKLVLEGIRSWDAGEKNKAGRLWLEALRRQPLGFVLSRPWLYFCLQKTLHRPYWDTLKNKMDGEKGRSQ